MEDSIIAIWIIKEHLHKVICYFEDILKFKFIESVVNVVLDSNTKDFIYNPNCDNFEISKNNLNDYFQRKDSTYFSNSKRTLLLFRKVNFKY
jgi:hypothetical protein